MSGILGREGLNAHTLGDLFKAFIQVVLLFESEIRVVTPRIGRSLGEFHQRVACWMVSNKT